MINPYSSYVVSFSFCLVAYVLGWSKIYPVISQYLLIFLVITIALHMAMAFYWKSKAGTWSPPTKESFLNPVVTTIFIYGLWTLDFLYEGGIPLFKILFNQPYNYRLFGVPSLHVFTVTFGSFFTVYLFSLFLSSGKRIHFYLYVVNLLAALLIYSRAMLIFNVFASIFVYLIVSPVFSWRRVYLITAGLIGLIYLFGVLGTLRVSFEANQKYNSNIFLDIGQASESFRASWLPNEFFWAYVYLTSPLANLQQNINTILVPPFTLGRTVQHVTNEMFLDFISKRINRLLGTERERENTLPDKPFNVSTVYSRSFSYQGWPGVCMIAVFILILPLIYLKFLPANSYQLTGMAILSTMYLFLFYDNTIRFTGLGLQLVYPFLLPAVERVPVWIRNKIHA